MTDADVVKYVLFGIVGIIMWFIRTTVGKMQEAIEGHEKQINDIKTNYLHRDDFKDFKIELRAMFDELKHELKDIKSK